MKRFISIILAIISSLSIFSVLSACNAGGPIYETEYSFDDEYHYRKQINGSGKIDEGKHVDVSGKCIRCGYYFENYSIMYRKTSYKGVQGWEVYDYDATFGSYEHVEIPAFYCEDEDEGYLPVLKIGYSALKFEVGKDQVCLKSIKLNEGIKTIGQSAFAYTDVEELIIPDSVEGSLSSVVMYNATLKKVVIGNGVTSLDGYCFAGCNNLQEVVLGSSLKKMAQRNFWNAKSVEYLVIPKSLDFIPEGSIKVTDNVGYHTLQDFIEGTDCPIYLNLTESEYNQLLRAPLPRRASDNYQTANSVDGLCYGWSGQSKVYFVDEWKYNSDGKPQPLSGKSGHKYSW